MSEKDFIDLVSRIGYANRSQCKEWIKKHPKEEYSDDDVNQVYLDCRNGYIKAKKNMPNV